MKIKIVWITYFHLCIGIILAGCFVLINHFYCKVDYEIFFAVIGSIIAITLTINYERFNKKKIFHEIFGYFNQRYDNLNENLNRLKEGKELKFKDCEEIDFCKRLFIYDYLNLCAEEYYWYKEGMINNKVWKNWSNGMNYFLHNKEIINVIKTERGEPYNLESYYGFLQSDFIKEILCDYNKTKS